MKQWYPVSNVCCNRNRIGVLMTINEINLALVLRWFRLWIHTDPCSCRFACSAIASSSCDFIHSFSRYTLFINARQIIWIVWRLIRFRSRCHWKHSIAKYSFGFNDRKSSMLGTVFIFHLLLKHLLVLGGSKCHVLRTNIHSFVPLPNQSRLSESIEDTCWNEQYTGHWTMVSILLLQHISGKLRGKVYVFFALYPLLR